MKNKHSFMKALYPQSEAEVLANPLKDRRLLKNVEETLSNLESMTASH